MQLNSFLLITFVANVLAIKNHNVSVGNAAGDNIFEPASIDAEVGDIVTFIFYPQNHSVVQGDFKNPCWQIDGGFYSGFKEVKEGHRSSEQFEVTVSNTEPIWFYCSQDHHCNEGMVGVINGPASGSSTLDAYKAAAIARDGSNTPNFDQTSRGGGTWVTPISSSTIGISTSSSLAISPSSLSSTISPSSHLSNSSTTITSLDTATLTTPATSPAGPTTTPAIAPKSTGGAASMGGSAVGLVALVAGAIVFG